MAINNSKENIERTKTVLDMVGKEDTPQQGQEVAENIVNNLVKEASNTIKRLCQLVMTVISVKESLFSVAS